jgi:DNA mismatch repair protein MutS
MVTGGGKMTPMMKQYHSLRSELPPDVLLLFRLGDFYELFFEDAREAAAILDVALTKRNGVPMCGFPFHAAQAYIARIIKAGRRVAIGEQVGEAIPGKIVRREIRQIISAGTVDDVNLLAAGRANYLAAVHHERRQRFGLALLDLTTGEFRAAEFATLSSLTDELGALAAAEILHADDAQDVFHAIADNPHSITCDAYTFLYDHASRVLTNHFGVHSLDGFGCSEFGPAVGAAGAILGYVTGQLRHDASHVRSLRAYSPEDFVQIDSSSRANLDLIDSRAGAKFSLLAALDRTRTPMGARLLRQWILHPLRQVAPLVARQEVIACLLKDPITLEELRTQFDGMRDIERCLSRLSQGSGTPRDVQSLALSLSRVPSLREQLLACRPTPALTVELAESLPDFTELVELITGALVEEPPALLRDGGVFRAGYNTELDELRQASSQGKRWISDLQTSEAASTGIKSLKIKYNAVFGYFIEVTKTNLSLVPDTYQRKQTTANAERFITPELKEVESKVLGADERAKALEATLFTELREQILEHLPVIQETAAALATVDVLCGLAETARLYRYCRPVLDDSLDLVIEAGRHPVVEQDETADAFVPNDVLLEPERSRLILLTGPNMAGKSTYIRQVALITLMAQIGSFVPAESATIGLADRIFTRVGASDDLARGQSTFMVEMNETALIVNTATERSLVILDEIGRGTATFDGLSIAWSVAEHLHDRIRARTLFATHYHELTALAYECEGVRNCNVAVREWNDEIIFLRKIVDGAADRSYGIQVARLAGLPDSIILRARQLLSTLEKEAADAAASARATRPEESKGSGGSPEKKSRAGKKAADKGPQDNTQLSLFS